MNRKSFIFSILSAAPVIASAGLLGQKPDFKGTVILVRKFFTKNNEPFNHEEFNTIINASFNMSYVQTDHQFMLDTDFIKKFERENFNDHVVFKISFNSIKDLEAYRNKISRVIVDRTTLTDRFHNLDDIIKA